MDTRGVARAEAVERLTTLLAERGSGSVKRVELSALAGRTLAEPLNSPGDVPPADLATMDGVAVATSDALPLELVGAVGPGDDPPALDAGEAVRIATGAALPERADAVVMREHVSVDGSRLVGVEGSWPPAPGTHLYPAGATAAAGEELFPAGHRLAPRHAALLRDVGIDEIPVRDPLTVQLVPTGDEIHAGTDPDRDSEMLSALLTSWGHEATVADPVPDDEDAVRAAIDDAVAEADLVVTTGGTSVGSGDHVGDVIAGYDCRFRGVALRPGRPTVAAAVRETPVVGLPGKPVAAHTAAVLLLGPALTGRTLLSTLSTELAVDLAVPDQPVEFAIPVTLADGHATPVGHASSSVHLYDDRFRPGRVSSSTRVTLADGVILTTSDLHAGEPVGIVPYEGVE